MVVGTPLLVHVSLRAAIVPVDTLIPVQPIQHHKGPEVDVVALTVKAGPDMARVDSIFLHGPCAMSWSMVLIPHFEHVEVEPL